MKKYPPKKFKRIVLSQLKTTLKCILFGFYLIDQQKVAPECEGKGEKIVFPS